MKLHLSDLNYQGRVTFTLHAPEVLQIPAVEKDPGRNLHAQVTVSMERGEWERLGRPVDLDIAL